MQINKLFPVRVGELFRNAIAVKRSSIESAQDELYGLPGDRVPYGWLQVEQELSRKFSQSPKTIDEIIELLRKWMELSITVIRERFDLHPVLNMTNDGQPVVSFDLVAKGNPFSVPPEDHQAWYLKWLKEKTQLLEIEYKDWESYWRETIESDETRRNVFLAMELGDALELLGLSHAANTQPPPMPTCVLNSVPAKMLRAIWKLVDWSSETWRADKVAIAMEVWGDGEKAEKSTFRYTLNNLQEALIESGDKDWLFDLKSPWVYVNRIR